MCRKNGKMKKLLQIIMWIVQGAIVGIGAILPGVSGGTLCYAFGIYNPLLEVLTTPIKGIKKHWKMLIFVCIGCAAGFIGFAGITASLLKWNAPVVLCAFIGLILGTMPDLWKTAGEKGRSKASFIALGVSFAAIFTVFWVFKSVWHISIPASIWGFAFCGFAWGLSFIIPGFSTSTLLMFFGIYTKMSEGINSFDMTVIIPMGLAMLVTILGLARVMRLVFDKCHNIASHSVLGFVLATTLMLFTASEDGSPTILSTMTGINIALYPAIIIIGAAAGFGLTLACDKIAKIADENSRIA